MVIAKDDITTDGNQHTAKIDDAIQANKLASLSFLKMYLDVKSLVPNHVCTIQY